MTTTMTTSAAPPTIDPAMNTVPVESAPSDNLSLPRNIKIGIFHIGSSMADILLGGVWNRIAIVELGFAAFPISLLLALRYFLAPLSLWAGQRSDRVPILGYRRIPYIWIGRAMYILSLMLLGVTTIVVKETGSPLGWIGMISAVIMFSVGGAISGTNFLALIYDRTPGPQRTRAVSVVWFFLILGFAISGILYSILLPNYTREGFLALFIIAPLVMGVLWFFSVLGEERRVKPDVQPVPKVADTTRQDFMSAIRTAWANRQTRLFFLFLGLTTLFFYTQDSILEPFAGQVFDMDARITNRFSAYWGSLTLIGIIVCLFLARRFPGRINNMTLSRWSVIILAFTFALFTVCALAQMRSLVTIGLIILGIGLGMWTVGTLGLMMDMTRITGAGLYLSLWSLSETLARGLGTLTGGAIRDVMLTISSSFPISYGAVFLFQAVGFAMTIFLLSRISVSEFHQGRPIAARVLEGAMD